MNRRAPRRAWPSACAACLFAVAAALFWPADDVPDLGRAAGSQPDARDADLATGRAAAPGRSPSGVSGRPDLAAGGSQAETSALELRDALASGPRLKAGPPVSWVQAPWHAFWSVARQEPVEVPVLQRAAAISRRPGGPALGPAARAAAAAPAPRLSSRAAPGSAASRAGRRLSPAAAARWMQALARRILAARLSSRDAAGPWRRARSGSLNPKGQAKRQARRPEAGPKREKPKAYPKFKPVLLSKLLGKNAIRPPLIKTGVPDLSPLLARVPKLGPDGKPFKWFPAGLAAVEAAPPPGPELTACKLAKGHWHAAPAGLYHDRTAWGLGGRPGWLWLKRAASHWWAWTAKDEPTWLWSRGHWWWKSDGIWFLLHQGEAWGYRIFGEYHQEGLIHPGTGTKMVYSADGLRVAVITPGDGAWLFDAVTGAILGRWSEEQMAKPKPPRAPETLPTPR